MTVRFSPATAGPVSGSVAVSSNGGSATVAVSGSGQTQTPGPQLSVSPTIFDFGSVPIGSYSETQSFEITNSGGGTLAGIIEYTLTPPTPFSLQQGQSGTFFIAALPGGPPGPFDFPILITSNGGDVTIHLTGTAVEVLPELSVSPLILDFGTFSAASGSSTLFITVTNTGGGILTGTISGYGDGTIRDFSLPAGQRESFSAAYAPGMATPGQNCAALSGLTVSSNGGNATVLIACTVTP